MLYVKRIRFNLTLEQQALIDSQSKICNWLYNHYLQVSKRYYGIFHKRLTYVKINHSFSEFKEKHPFLKTVNNSVLKNTLRTLDKAITKFLKEKKTGFPKFKSWKRHFRSLEYELGVGFTVIDLSKIEIHFGRIVNPETGKYFNPKIDVKLDESLDTKHFQLTVTKEGNKYFGCFRYEKDNPKIKEAGNVVALDLNQSNLYAMVDDQGNSVIMDKPIIAKYFDTQIDRIKSKRDKCKKYSRRYRYLNKTIQRLYSRRRDQIKLMCYTVSHRIVRNTKLVLIGDYVPFASGISNINHGVLAQGLVGQFRKILLWVCEKTGTSSKVKDEYRTSKTCSKCGHVKSDLVLSDRVYSCDSCGMVENRDVNSAINIMEKELPRIGERYVVVSTANWTWMSNCLSTVSMQINGNIGLCNA